MGLICMGLCSSLLDLLNYTHIKCRPTREYFSAISYQSPTVTRTIRLYCLHIHTLLPYCRSFGSGHVGMIIATH